MRQSIHDRPTSQLKGETTEHSFHPRWQKVVKMFKQMHWQQNESIKDNSAWGLVIRVLKYALTLTLHGVTSKTTNPITCGDKETHKTNLCVCVLLYLYLFSIYIYIYFNLSNLDSLAGFLRCLVDQFHPLRLVQLRHVVHILQGKCCNSPQCPECKMAKLISATSCEFFDWSLT